MKLGYTLSSEEHRPNALIEIGQRAEAAGFEFLSISDHFHPWVDAQGQSPFVWATLGGLAQATSTIRVGTGVTCPIMRVHPVILAQAVATTADMFGGRFYWGVGAGEALNEHIVGETWPPVSVRHDMLREAIAVIRRLWEGEYTTHRGLYYTVDNARIYTLPETLPEIIVAAKGPKAARLAAEIGDGLDCTEPKAEMVETFQSHGGKGDRYGQLTVCFGHDRDAAIDLALKVWPTAALPGQLGQDLALPLFYEQAATLATPEEIAKSVVCGDAPEAFHAAIRKFDDAGFTHVYIHQVGQDQAPFIEFAEKELLPAWQ